MKKALKFKNNIDINVVSLIVAEIFDGW